MIQRRQILLDGLHWSFLEKGKARQVRPTIVLLHGLMGCADTFLPLIDSLDDDLHLVVIDLPGSGQSERRPDIDARLDVTANQVVRLFRLLGIQRPVLLGHSHGGAVALSVAARHRDAIRSLVLLAPAHPYFDEGDPLVRFYLSLPGRLFAYSMPWYPAWLQRFGLRRMAGKRRCDTQEMLRPYRDNLRTPGTMSHLLRLLQTWKKDFYGLHKALRKPLEMPCMLIWGDSDRAVPASSAEKLRQRLTRSEMVVLPGVGHRPAEEAPADVARLLHAWLEQDVAPQAVRYSPKFSPSHVRISALMPSILEAGD